MKKLLIGCGIAAGLFMALIMGLMAIGFFAAKSADKSNSERKPHVAPTAPSAPTYKWKYKQEKDEMRGSVIITSYVTTDDLMGFDFPYKNSYGVMQLVWNEGKSADAIVGVSAGQMLCGIRGCSVEVKFDDGHVMTWKATPPGGGVNNAVFLSNQKSFIEKIKAAKRVMIEAEFYSEGRKVMKFETAGLEWPPKSR